MKSLVFGAAIAALCACSAVAAPQAAALQAPAWAIAPTDVACHTDIELTGRSGAAVVVQLESDGDRVSLRFPRGDIPERAFLPIRVDGKPFSNLVQSTADPKAAAMTLSDETMAALRKGQTLQIAWLADEAVRSALTGVGQGLTDLRTCGAQVAGQARSRAAQIQAAQVRAEAEARAKAVADEQLAAARAQTAAALAEQRKVAAEADRATAEAEQQRTLADANRQRAAMDAARQKADADEQAYDYARAQQQQQRYAQPDPYAYYRPYYPR